jgi:hypothetical protein
MVFKILDEGIRVINFFPWQELIDAQKPTAKDYSRLHYGIAEALLEQGDLSGHPLRVKKSEIEKDFRKKLHVEVRERSRKLVSDEVVETIANETIDYILSNKIIWDEIIHHYHSTVMDHSPIVDKKHFFIWIFSINNQIGSSEQYFSTNPNITPDQFIDLNRLQQLFRGGEIIELLVNRLTAELNQCEIKSKLPCRIPENEKLAAVYISASKLLYILIEKHCHDGYGYNHLHISAGERAFSCLFRLGVLKGPNGELANSRFSSSPPHAVFTCTIEDLFFHIEQKSELAPSLGELLQAIDFMSRQYATGVEIGPKPVKASEVSIPFIETAIAAGLCKYDANKNVIWQNFQP